uniref:Uncharacterized protein n=1 Tax=Pararge aegeria TaxID=116150 RepID=S4P4J5_9NEOP
MYTIKMGDTALQYDLNSQHESELFFQHSIICHATDYVMVLNCLIDLVCMFSYRSWGTGFLSWVRRVCLSRDSGKHVIVSILNVISAIKHAKPHWRRVISQCLNYSSCESL